MRRLNPDDPADQVRIAQNVTSMGVVVNAMVVVVAVLALIFVRAWPLRTLFVLAAALGGMGLAYYFWLFREVRRNPAFAANFKYRPRPVIDLRNRKFVALAMVGVIALVLSPRIGGRGVLVAGAILMVISVLGLLRRKRG
jgi:Flp pilus assembly protein TadB